MKSIASLEADMADGLLERLKQESIPFEVRKVTQASGLDYDDIMVGDGYYDRACDVAEAWETARIAEAEKRSNRHCPTCGSSHLEYVGDSSFGGSIWKCKDCGNVFSK
jgi:predicted RNA-binding Zn-ribbon protein involved in translation (DUF1610 family)